MDSIIIDRNKCIGCGLCAKDCVYGCLEVYDGKAILHSAGCIECGHCYAVCPENAVLMKTVQPEEGTPVPMTAIAPETLLSAMKSRRTIRQFRPEPVEEEILHKIIEAGRYCPTATNSQDVAYTILGSRQQEIEKICVELLRKGTGVAGYVSDYVKNLKIDDQFFFKGAPLVIVVSGKNKGNAYLASSYMELMAESLGLGVLYSGFFVACTVLSPKVRQILGLPQGHKAVTCMVMGYPAVNYRRIPGRKPANVKKL